MKYNVKKRYAATMQRNGSNEMIVLEKGEAVELADDIAAFIRVDCPGAITRAKGVKKGAQKKG